MARGRAEFGVDMSGVHAAAGMMEGMSSSMMSRTYVGSALRYTHGVLSEAFDHDLDKWALANANEFHHVYEWGAVGVPQGRLWRHHLRGRSRDRVATFEFLPSKVPVPVPETLLQPGPSGKTVKEGVHIFAWKAPIMEYGLSVTIRPKHGEWLAFAVGEGDGLGYLSRYQERNAQRGIAFTQGPVTMTPGKHVQGNFTLFFSTWWSGRGQELFDQGIKTQLENDLGNVQYESYIKGVRTGRFTQKTFSIKTPSAARGVNSRAFQQARLEAKAFVEKQAGKMDRRTAKRWREANAVT